jgi:hypothetical protein
LNFKNNRGRQNHIEKSTWQNLWVLLFENQGLCYLDNQIIGVYMCKLMVLENKKKIGKIFPSTEQIMENKKE